MPYPGIGTVNPAHQLETTSNVTAESLEIYSDYTFFSSSAYNWARQLRLRVKTPGGSSSNVFVDMGLEKDNGAYFYISKPLSEAVNPKNPKNNFRIYENGRILINRTTARDEKLQVGGSVRVTGNLNVTGTTTVSGDVNITGDLHVTSFSQEQNYIVPVGMIVMWDGEINAIPPGWALVTGVSGYYLRSNTTQTSVVTKVLSSFKITEMIPHTHNTVQLNSKNSANTGHTHTIGTTGEQVSNVTHNHGFGTLGEMGDSSHYHNYSQLGPNNVLVSTGGNNMTNVLVGTAAQTTMNSYFYLNDFDYAIPENHTHNTSWSVNGTNATGSHNHNYKFNSITATNATHTHANLPNVGSNSITVNLTPSYRKIRLIKKLAYT